MENENIYYPKMPLIVWVIFISLSINITLSQDKWIKVENPNKNLISFVELSENYYLIPKDFFKKDFTQKGDFVTEISLPNETGKEEIFQIKPVPLFSEKLSKKYPEIKTFWLLLIFLYFCFTK